MRLLVNHVVHNVGKQSKLEDNPDRGVHGNRDAPDLIGPQATAPVESVGGQGWPNMGARYEWAQHQQESLEQNRVAGS